MSDVDFKHDLLSDSGEAPEFGLERAAGTSFQIRKKNNGLQ